MGRRKRRRRYRLKARFWVFLCLMLLVAVVGIFLSFRSCDEKEPEVTPKKAAQGVGLLESAADAGEEYLDQILFIGDSRTLGLSSYGFLPGEQVLAETSLTHKNARKNKIDFEGKKIKIADAVGKIKPQAMLVSFGINSIATTSENDFMNEYKGLIDDLKDKSPDSIMVIQSIYPVSEGKGYEIPEMNNEKIDLYNGKLLAIAKEMGCYYLNTSEVLKDKEGGLHKQYDGGDGVHINTKAYETILKYIREHPIPGLSVSQADSTDTGASDDPSASSDADETESGASDDDK